MKSNNILSFILGACLVLFLAAGRVSTAMYPIQPTEVYVATFRGMLIEPNIKKEIESRHKSGWIVKSLAMSEDENYAKAVVVFEKY